MMIATMLHVVIYVREAFTRFQNYSVRNNDHLTGKYRGGAHNKCNINDRKKRNLTVFFHILKYKMIIFLDIYLNDQVLLHIPKFLHNFYWYIWILKSIKETLKFGSFFQPKEYLLIIMNIYLGIFICFKIHKRLSYVL